MTRPLANTLLALIVLTPAIALASDPAAIFCDPRKVDLLPDDANPTRMVIHGTFTMRTGGSYTAPVCGYMYFACRTGQEGMCRLQWRELRDMWIGHRINGHRVCAGFGQFLVDPVAKVRPAGTPLAAPDLWDLGMGIVAGFELPERRCPQTIALSCNGLGRT